MPKYSELSIDGVVGDIYDKEAVHESEIKDILLEYLVDIDIKTVILEVLYPVGSVKVGGPNPGTYLGGRWESRPDVMIVGAGNKYAVGRTGGSANPVVVAHNHTTNTATTSSAGAHTHSVSATAASAGNHRHNRGSSWSEGSGSASAYKQSSDRKGADKYTGYAGTHTHSCSGTAASAGAHTHTVSVTVNNNGESGIEKNMPPYRAYNVWERIQ